MLRCVADAARMSLLVIGMIAAGCGHGDAQTRNPAETDRAPISSSATTEPAFAAVADQKNLHNAHVISEKVISGAQPEGAASFEALRELGVKSIISVDGAKPDVAMAHKYGMRYVHLPIGYDGVSPEEGRAIAKAIDELPGKVYVHCHHGKHRSAAAVAVACVNLSILQPEQAEDVLKTFGTGENYLGLWKAAREARPVDVVAIRELDVQFVEQSKIGDYAQTMVQADQHWDNVKLIQKSGWKKPVEHPDLDPAHEVLMVQENLHEGGRLESTSARPAAFKALLGESEKATIALGELLRRSPIDAKAADAQFAVVSNSCLACHKRFRD